MPIEGKVAAIVNERDLVINRGSDAGVEEGMKFGVIEGEVPVKDPDTGEILVKLKREKIRVKIVEVHSKYSIGKTYQTYRVNVGGYGSIFDFNRLATPRQEVTRVRTIRTSSQVDQAAVPVDIGDMVVEVEQESSVRH